MATTYEDKINKLSDWYDNLLFKNRLLLTVEGTNNLQSILLESSVVNFYTQGKDDNSLVLTNETYGLFQIRFYLDGFGNDRRLISLKPFSAFNNNFESYIQVIYDVNLNNIIPYTINHFDSLDSDVVKKLFNSNFDDIVALIHNANTSMVETIETKMHEFMRKTSFSSLEKNKKGELMFLFDDGSLINSLEDLFKKYKKEFEHEFFNKHSVALAKTNQFIKEMNRDNRFGNIMIKT